MAVSLSSKKRSVIRSTLLVLAVAAVFFASAQLAGETADTVYFSGKQQ